jgi:uncharacterized RDD family membrane protein YckC
MDEFCGNCGAKMDLSLSNVCPNCGAKSGASKSTAEVSTESSGNYAGFWVRFFAFLIDGVILLIPFAICFGIAGQSNTSLGFFLSWIVGFAYFAYLESSTRRATFGKQAMGVIVTKMDGSQLTFQEASIRYIAKLLSAVILYIGFIMIGFTEKKQGLHDMIAHTIVIRK